MPRLAVIGYPVGHSRSPAMQTAALEAAGLADEWSYEPIEVEPAHFEAKLRGLAESDFAGVNVTVPHKQEALAIADTASLEAEAIGAANTLVFDRGGIAAHNTDAGGLLGALGTLPASPRGIRALVLGAGGAARAAIWALNEAGAVVYVWNRTGSRAAQVCMELGGAVVEDFKQSAFGIVVNTTTVGLYGEEPFESLRLEEATFGEYTPGEPPLRAAEFDRQVVVDMVYGEESSRLLAVAAEHGATVVDGLEILVQQGARSFEIWTGVAPNLAAMRAAARR